MIRIKGLTTETWADVDLTAYGCTPGTEQGTYIPGSNNTTILSAGTYVIFNTAKGATPGEIVLATIMINGVTYSDDTVSFEGYLTEPIRISGPHYRLITITKCQACDLLTEEELADVHLYFPFSPTGETLEAATADFKILSTRNDLLLPAGREFGLYDNYGIVGTFYILDVLREGAGIVSVSAVDIVGYIERYTFAGYIGYKHGTSSTAAEIVSTVQDIVPGLFPEGSDITTPPQIPENVKTQKVYGYIPRVSNKDALQYICIGCGLALRTFRVPLPVFASADEYDTHVIPDTDVFSSSGVQKNDESKTAVKIRQTDYIGDTDGVIYSYDLQVGEVDTYYTLTIGDIGSDVINPGSDCTAFCLCAPGLEHSGGGDGLYTTTKGVTVVSNTGVTAVINAGNTGDGHYTYMDEQGQEWRRVVLKGTKVMDVYERVNADAWYITYGDGTVLDVSDDATTVTWDNSDTIAERMIAHHKAPKNATISFVASGAEKPGDKLQLSFADTYGATSGRIVSIDMDLGGGKTIADVTLMCD